MMTIARGLGRLCPIRARALVVADCSIARVGAPWDMNNAGSLAAFFNPAGASAQATAALIGLIALASS